MVYKEGFKQLYNIVITFCRNILICVIEGTINSWIHTPVSAFEFGIENGIKNILEDQYPVIYLSIILKSYLARKRRLADGDTKRKLADTQTDTLT